MAGASTSIFTDFDEYRHAFRDAKIDSVYGNVSEFRARLTWVELKWLKLLRVHEHLPHIAIIVLSPSSLFVAFPAAAAANAMPTWCGVPLRRSDIVVHSLGQCVYEYTRGSTTWASISVPPERLAAYGRVWAELDLKPPQIGQVLDPSAASMAQLRRLHAKVCRLVVTRPEIIAHKEVIRSLEEELVQALIGCLVGGTTRADLHDSEVMRRVDDFLTGQPQHDPTVTELCATIGLSERTLRAHCKRFVGMSPADYVLMRRMNFVRTALRDSKSAEIDLASIVSDYGFQDIERFIRQYKDIFGEEPTTKESTEAASKVAGIIWS